MRKFRQQNDREGEAEHRANQAGREQRQHRVELVESQSTIPQRQTIEQLEMHIQSDIDTNTVTVADTVTVTSTHTRRQTAARLDSKRVR